jgi:hypothetical protein
MGLSVRLQSQADTKLPVFNLISHDCPKCPLLCLVKDNAAISPGFSKNPWMRLVAVSLIPQRPHTSLEELINQVTDRSGCTFYFTFLAKNPPAYAST